MYYKMWGYLPGVPHSQTLSSQLKWQGDNPASILEHAHKGT